VATLHPDQSWEKVVFDPWRQDSWDANDTVLISDPSTDPDVGVYFARLPSADYMPTWYAQRIGGGLGGEPQDAAQKAQVHAATPKTIYSDSLARAFLTIEFNRSQLGGAPPVESRPRTGVLLDIKGNPLMVTDALGRVMMTYDYDLMSTRIHQSSPDSGDRWNLNDATGKPLVGWDSRDHEITHDYDAALRPTQLWVQTGSGPTQLVEETVYGEGQPDAAALNLLGRPYQQIDQAGVLTNHSFDFTGNLTASSREFLVEYSEQVDWSLSPAPTLTGEVFMSSSTFDALNRPVTITSPDGSITEPAYDDTGLLDQLTVTLNGATTSTTIISTIDYNAKGQRTLISLGNGAQTVYTYDPATFRLDTLTTTRSKDSAPLQALTYTYDAIGNITHIEDTAQQTIYFNNAIVDPSNDYVYDARYRLIQAQGRELIGLVSQPWTTWDDSARMNQMIPHPSDAQALRSYTETYTYDVVGNFLSLAHRATGGNWTRTYAYDEPTLPPGNNRLTSTTVGSIVEPYTYDAHGNMTSMPSLSLMAWDFKDELQATESRVANDAPVETTYYVYNASGERVRKVNETAAGSIASERIYLCGYEVYREYDTTGTMTLERQTLHVMDDKERVAMVETRTVGNDRTAQQLIRYQFGNHLDSVSLELDATARIISYEEYYPYGSTSYQAVDQDLDPAPKRYRYTAKERDEETGLNYHGARYCAPWLGRWISCDPAGNSVEQSSYRYSSNNPTNFFDLNGATDSPASNIDNIPDYDPDTMGKVIGPPVTAPPPPIKLSDNHGGHFEVSGIDFAHMNLPDGAQYFPDLGRGSVIAASEQVITAPMPQNPDVSDPHALKQAKGMAHVEVGDAAQCGKGLVNSLSWLHGQKLTIDPDFAGAAEACSILGTNLQFEATAGLGYLAEAGQVEKAAASTSELRGYSLTAPTSMPVGKASAREFSCVTENTNGAFSFSSVTRGDVVQNLVERIANANPEPEISVLSGGHGEGTYLEGLGKFEGDPTRSYLTDPKLRELDFLNEDKLLLKLKLSNDARVRVFDGSDPAQLKTFLQHEAEAAAGGTQRFSIRAHCYSSICAP
jgi:RHS repeat-associated protein